jgi:hypothetical protein
MMNAEDAHELLLDPITKEPLVEPVLASDGETYSLETLLAAMKADPWHRSPMTYEVLRPEAFPNTFVAKYMGQDPLPPGAVTLFPPHTDANSRTAHARVLGIQMPQLVGVEDTLARRGMGLPDAAYAIQAVVTRDAAGLDWLMYPPCPAEMRCACLRLARSTGLDKLVQNPWCLGGAMARPSDRTLEDLWCDRDREDDTATSVPSN